MAEYEVILYLRVKLPMLENFPGTALTCKALIFLVANILLYFIVEADAGKATVAFWIISNGGAIIWLLNSRVTSPYVVILDILTLSGGIFTLLAALLELDPTANLKAAIQLKVGPVDTAELDFVYTSANAFSAMLTS